MALEISGKVVLLMPAVTGSGANGSWTKRDFVIETADQYPKKVCFSAWNDKAALLDRVSEGQEVKVSFDVQSREYNQKWYTDLRIWKLETGGASAPVSQPQNNGGYTAAPEQINEQFNNTDGGDLPF